MDNHPGDKPVQRLIAYFAGILAFLVFAVLAWGTMTFVAPRPEKTEAARIAAERKARLVELRAAESEALSAAAVVDENLNLVQIPIEHAVRLVLPQLEAKEAKPSAFTVPGSPAAMRMIEEANEARARADAEKKAAQEAAESPSGDAPPGTGNAPEATPEPDENAPQPAEAAPSDGAVTPQN